MSQMADEETPAERLALTFELFEFGVEMMAANLRRRHPGATPDEIERLLEEWLAERPGAELGDGVGVPVPLTRFR
jgi:Rv0078B-related antitoxin